MRVKVDGVEYPLPELDDLDMDECILLERVAGVGIEELDGDHTPLGAVKALVMIAIMRANPDTKAKEVEPLIGHIKIRELGEMFDSVGDARPPSTKPEPEASTGTSGTDSTEGSEPTPHSTGRNGSGTQGSATTPISDPGTLAR